jgi:hypothetical protein
MRAQFHAVKVGIPIGLDVLADKCCKDVEAEENAYPIMMFGVMTVADGLHSDCQSTINKKGVRSCKRSLNGGGSML